MRITGCEVFVVQLPARRDHTWATKPQGLIGRHAIVRVDTDEGLSGWGEAPAIPSWGGDHGTRSGETPETVRHVVLDHLMPAVHGLDPAAIAVLHRRMDGAIVGHPYAKAALDIACHDIAGRALGVPVSTLLGGRFRESLEIVHSLGIMEIDRCLDEAEQAAAEGIRTFKCKTGRDAERDVVLVRAMRERLGDGARIRVDANQGYASADEAIAVTLAQQEHGLLLTEQPVEGIDALARVAQGVAVPVMADESAWSVRDILALHAAGAASCFSCYVTKPGGLYHARRQGEIAQTLGMACDIGGSGEGGIGNAANLHLGAALESARLACVVPVTSLRGSGPEVAARYYLDDLVVEPPRFSDGALHVPDGPGLGVEVDLDKLRHYSQ